MPFSSWVQRFASERSRMQWPFLPAAPDFRSRRRGSTRVSRKVTYRPRPESVRITGRRQSDRNILAAGFSGGLVWRDIFLAARTGPQGTNPRTAVFKVFGCQQSHQGIEEKLSTSLGAFLFNRFNPEFQRQVFSCGYPKIRPHLIMVAIL
jgi:hypothetical protein